MPALRRAPATTRESGVELRAYRLVCLMTVVSVPTFGHVYQHIDPTFYDPIWIRWVLAGLVLALGAGTYVSRWVQVHLETLAALSVFVFVAWFAALTALNRLAPEYALGYMLVLMIVGVANLGMKRLRVMALCTLFAVAAAVIVAFALPSPRVDPVVYAACVAAGGIVTYISTWIRLRMRRHIYASEARYRTVFECATDGLFLTDAETLRFLHANDAYLALTGYTLDELRDRTLHDVVVAEPDYVDWTAQELMEQGRLSIGAQQHRRKDGTTVDLEIGVNCLEQDGRTVFCTTAHDLTEQQRVRAELEAAKERAEEMLRLKSSFLNNMSHELRTPLVSILGFAELLIEETDEDQREMAVTIHRSAKRLHDTVNSVLDLAQIEGGGVEFSPDVVDIGAEAEDLALLLRPVAESKGLALRVAVAPEAHVLVDRTALRRILTHLLSNAIKFTDKGGIGLDVEADSHRVVVRVSDTGIGISEDFLPHLFDEFKQESTGIGRGYEGNGLGLAISKRLVDMMGGRIMVDSMRGEGTVFAVAFARTWVRPAEGADGLSETEPTTSLFTSRPRVLVVEDNADTRRLIERTLAGHYDVEAAADAGAGLALARRAWFDLLLLDVNLGSGPDGLALLRELRAMSAYAYVPALAVTALALPGDRERILDAGFDDYLAKPFTRDALLYALGDVLAAQQGYPSTGDGSGSLVSY